MARGLIVDARFLFSSGIGVYLRMTLPYVMLNSKAAKIIIYCRSEHEHWLRQFPSDKIEIRILNAPFYSIREQIFWLGKLFRHKNFLFWSPQYNAPFFHRGPLLTTVYDLGHLSLPLYQNSHLKSMYARLLYGRMTKKAQKIFCISEYTAKDLLKWTHVDPNKIVLTHLAIDANRFQNKIKPQLNLPKNFAFFVGNIKVHKNLENLIAAFAIVQKKTDLQLVIAGQKEGFITAGYDICEIARQKNVQLLFTGQISDAELAYLYTEAKIFVFPSRFEGFGLPPLEAMALGCPVVASNLTSIPEVCGEAAEYFNPDNIEEMAETVLRVALNKDLREDLISKGKQRLAYFQLEDLQKKTLAEIDQLLTSGVLC